MENSTFTETDIIVASAAAGIFFGVPIVFIIIGAVKRCCKKND